MTDPSTAVAHQVKDFRELPGLKGMSITRMHADDASALGATKPFELEQRGRKETVLLQLTLIKSRGLWVISDIDLETRESAKAQLAKFLRAHPKAIPARRGAMKESKTVLPSKVMLSNMILPDKKKKEDDD